MSLEKENDDLVTQLFSTRDILDNITEVRQKLQREKNVVDSQLQAGIQAQVQPLLAGLSLLLKTRNHVDNIQSVMGEIHTIHRDSAESIPEFDKIKRLSLVAANFDTTRKFTLCFETYESDLAEVQSLLEADGEVDIDSRMPNLLKAHYALTQMRNVQDEMMYYAKGLSQYDRTELSIHFEKLNKLVFKFDSIVMEIASFLLEILRSGDPSLVVRVAKIIDFEEKQDLLASMAQTVNNQKSSTNRCISATIQRPPRNYPKRFFESIERSVNETFDACMEQFSPKENPEELLENVNWIYSDLAAARELLAPRVPARWEIFDKYVTYIHHGTHRMMNSIMVHEPAANVLLSLLQFSKDYYKNMNTKFGKSKKTLEPPLLDGKEKELYDDYLQMLVQKLKEWYATIAVQERHPFLSRSAPPQTHSDGTLGLEGQVTMSKLIAQHLDVAANSGQGRIVAGCVDACCAILMERQQDWIKLIKSELEKELDPEPKEEVPPGLFEYLMALANDQTRADAFLSELSAKWSEPLSRKYQAIITARFEQAQEGYTDVAVECINGMIAIILSDSDKAFKQLYTGSRWYKGVVIREIIDTLADFAEEALGQLDPELFEIFIGKLCCSVMRRYLEALKHAHGKIKIPQGPNRIIEDVTEFFDFFTKPGFNTNETDVIAVLSVSELLRDVLLVPVEEITSLFVTLRERFWDAPLELFELMVGARRDLDKKTSKTILSKVRIAAAEMHVEQSEEQLHTYLHEFKGKTQES